MNELKYIIDFIGVIMMICTIIIAILLLSDGDNYTDRDYYTAVMAGFFTATIGFVSIVFAIYFEHDKK